MTDSFKIVPKVLPIRKMNVGTRVRAWPDLRGARDGEISSLSIQGGLEEIMVTFDDIDVPVGPFKPDQIQILSEI